MAIEYTDVYTVPALQARVNSLSSALSSNLLDDFIKQKKTELKHQIANLKKREEKLFNMFGDSINNIHDLNKRLQEYKQITLHLSGPELYKEYLYQLEDANRTSATIFSDAVRETIADLVNGNGKLSLDSNVEYQIQPYIMTVLNQGINGKHFQFKSKKGWHVTKLSDLEAYLFTKEQQDALQRLIIEKYADQDLANKEGIRKFLMSKDVIENNGNSLTFNWLNITNKMKPTDYISDEALNNINNIIKEKIVSDVPSQYQKLMRETIDYVLSKERTSFLVGYNTKAITGILGEIQSLFYINLLLGNDDGSRSIQSLAWKGGIIQDGTGKKPHQDIVLENIGIQVKNTAKDLLQHGALEVGFWNQKLSEFMSKLELDESIASVFKSYFATYVFNIPYIKDSTQPKGQRYQKADQSESMEYNSTRARLEALQSQVDRLMSVFTAALMYMDVGDDIDAITDLNTIYFLGGVAAVTAADVLEKTLAKLETIFPAPTVDLSTTATSELNIVSALNSNRKHTNYHQEILDNIFLRSSYVFKLEDLI